MARSRKRRAALSEPSREQEGVATLDGVGDHLHGGVANVESDDWSQDLSFGSG